MAVIDLQPVTKKGIEVVFHSAGLPVISEVSNEELKNLTGDALRQVLNAIQFYVAYGISNLKDEQFFGRLMQIEEEIENLLGE